MPTKTSVSVVQMKADVEAEINRLVAVIESGMKSGYPPTVARLQNAAGKLGMARCDLSDTRFPAQEQINGALGRIQTAKALMAEAAALLDERNLRLSWGESWGDL